LHKSGPLNEKTRALIKLAISTGAGMEGAVHSHMRKAMEAGCAKAEIRQTVTTCNWFPCIDGSFVLG